MGLWTVEDVSGFPGSLPDRLMSQIYQYFENRTSPVGDRASRRQRKREKERQGRRKWEPEHCLKIVNCLPTPSRPLQGLWKGICDDKTLKFYLVAYDDIGGIACRKVGDSSHLFSDYSPVSWTSNTKFTESPFSPEEEYIYNSAYISGHLQWEILAFVGWRMKRSLAFFISIQVMIWYSQTWPELLQILGMWRAEYSSIVMGHLGLGFFAIIIL